MDGTIGNYFDMTTTFNTGPQVDLFMVPNLPLTTTEYSDFLDWLDRMTDDQTGTPGLDDDVLRRWEPPIHVYIPPLVRNGLDYRPVIEAGFHAWETATGLSLFQFVDTQPVVGVHIRYIASELRDLYEVTERDAALNPTHGRVSIRTAYDGTMIPGFTAIVSHEAGHVLGLSHSNDQRHLMVGWRSPGSLTPTQEEVWLATALYRLPRGINKQDLLHE